MKNNQVPLKLIHILADGQCYSGEKLGAMLNISRAAINKHIQTLRGWGIEISAIQRKGYRLLHTMNLIDEHKISRSLQDIKVWYLPIIDSTNQYLLDRIPQLRSGDICISEYQLAARGRRGRRWFAPFGVNLYYSIYWCLMQGPIAAMGLSLVIGIVVAETLHSLGEKKIKVKWPNDLYLEDKKLAGILVELTAQTGDVAHVVTGIGINLNMYNPDISVVTQPWANLGELTLDRTELIIVLTQKLSAALQQFEKEGLKPFVSRWMPLDNFYNRPVRLIIGDKIIKGVAKGITEQGALLLDQNGVLQTFVGGEISLRADND